MDWSFPEQLSFKLMFCTPRLRTRTDPIPIISVLDLPHFDPQHFFTHCFVLMDDIVRVIVEWLSLQTNTSQILVVYWVYATSNGRPKDKSLSVSGALPLTLWPRALPRDPGEGPRYRLALHTLAMGGPTYLTLAPTYLYPPRPISDSQWQKWLDVPSRTVSCWTTARQMKGLYCMTV